MIIRIYEENTPRALLMHDAVAFALSPHSLSLPLPPSRRVAISRAFGIYSRRAVLVDIRTRLRAFAHARTSQSIIYTHYALYFRAMRWFVSGV